jgi:hypothetical protein
VAILQGVDEDEDRAGKQVGNERADEARMEPELRQAFSGLGLDIDTMDDDTLAAILDGTKEDQEELDHKEMIGIIESSTKQRLRSMDTLASCHVSRVRGSMHIHMQAFV